MKKQRNAQIQHQPPFPKLTEAGFYSKIISCFEFSRAIKTSPSTLPKQKGQFEGFFGSELARAESGGKKVLNVLCPNVPCTSIYAEKKQAEILIVPNRQRLRRGDMS